MVTREEFSSKQTNQAGLLILVIIIAESAGDVLILLEPVKHC